MKIMKTIATYTGAGLIAFSPMGCNNSRIEQLEQQKAQLERKKDSLNTVQENLKEQTEIKKQKLKSLEMRKQSLQIHTKQQKEEINLLKEYLKLQEKHLKLLKKLDEQTVGMHKENTDTQRFIDSVKNTETYKKAQRCYDSIQNLNFKNAKQIAIDTAKKGMHY